MNVFTQQWFSLQNAMSAFSEPDYATMRHALGLFVASGLVSPVLRGGVEWLGLSPSASRRVLDWGPPAVNALLLASGAANFNVRFGAETSQNATSKTKKGV